MDTAPRHDIYAFIHKGLRAFMSHTLVRLGRVDVNDRAELAEVSEEVRALLALCRDHVHSENTFVHPAIAARSAGRTAAFEREHAGHEREIDALEALVAELPGSAAALRRLYLALSVFVAENFEHMQREETELNAALWATHTDDEIRAVEARIVASHQPEEMQVVLRWMLPHLAPEERAQMLGGMRAAAPAPVFEGTLALIRPLLGGRDWRKLASALGL
ncbi:MAG: hemerythrin domain-containing protein [Rubrivivax sp.]|nr:hemerythrin domain-containing protein [Rubrivivax sp.]